MNALKTKSSHPVDVHVGNKLRKRRAELGVSQEELGEAVSLTFQQIQKYEKGYNRISSSKLYEFAKFLKISVNYFFDGIEDYAFDNSGAVLALAESGADDYEAEIPRKEIEQLYAAYASVKDAQVRKNILNLVGSISKEETEK